MQQPLIETKVKSCVEAPAVPRQRRPGASWTTFPITMLRSNLRKEFSFKPDFDTCGGNGARCAGGARVNVGRRPRLSVLSGCEGRQRISSRFGHCESFAQRPRLFWRQCLLALAWVLAKPLRYDQAAIVVLVGRQEVSE